MTRQRADVLLVARGVFDSRARARAAIEAGNVTADGRPVAKPSEMLDDRARLHATPAHPWVGRGGIKLDHALSLWPVEAVGRVVVDLGASTGGFTQVCLSRGAARVYAVDVGRGQLHPIVRDDPRVTELSETDVRDLDRHLILEAPQLLVSDLSFIGLAKALPAALALAGAGADLICLVKPQFEAAGPDEVGKGVVRDPARQEAALARVAAWLDEQGWTVRATADSPILGGDGNREFLLWASKKPPA